MMYYYARTFFPSLTSGEAHAMTLSDREAAVLFHTYKRLPLEIERGDGAYLIAETERGIWTCSPASR